MLDQFLKDGLIVIPKLLLSKYKQLSISSDAFVLLLGILDLYQHGHDTIEVEAIKADLGWSMDEIYQPLSQLMEKKLISFEWLETSNGKQHESISLKPLFEHLESFYDNQSVIRTDPEDFTLVQIFEQEFGRPLSPIELGQISKWRLEDKMSDDLIQLALTQAVLNQAYSFKYIDKILLSWLKRNIRTLEEAKREIDSFNHSKSQREAMNVPLDLEGFKLPNINWD